jgi:hypothetical protein
VAVTASGSSSGRERHGRHSPNIWISDPSISGAVTVVTTVTTFWQGVWTNGGNIGVSLLVCLWCAREEGTADFW